MSTPFNVVIPARYGSTRLPGKPLLNIAGKAMIIHVCERARQAGAEEIVVATDDRRIFDAVTSFGVNAAMTDIKHRSGTERIAEVAEQRGWNDSQIIVNLQGDEPLIPPGYIREVAEVLAGQQLAGMATLAAPIRDTQEVFNPNAVKVVLDQRGCALYFSRAPIPWDRDGFKQSAGEPLTDRLKYLRHIGIYAYTVGFIKRYIDWEVSPLEAVESLEQLRVLWHGEVIRVSIVPETPEAGVDTEADLQRVAELLT